MGEGGARVSEFFHTESKSIFFGGWGGGWGGACRG